jgi:glycosyltransferase involved in cell wall biosynthesis
MVSVIVAAHNEEAVIGRCLDALRDQHVPTTLQIIVSANGCTDRTTDLAAAHGATVVDRVEPGKAGALNAADRIATSFPRVYLDADIVVPPDAIERILDALSASPRTLAVVPRRRIDTHGRPFPVRAYFAINERLPAFRHGLFGRGMITLSDAGRSRFNGFPPMIADDLFVDSLFSDDEKAEIKDVEVVVEAPYSTRDLLARLVRVRRGNAQLRAASASGDLDVAVRRSDRWAWLRDVVLPEPDLAFAAVPYLAITLLAGVLARRPGQTSWGRDHSTRDRRVERSPKSE